MDDMTDPQLQILQNIFQQMVTVNQRINDLSDTLSARITESARDLGARIDQTNARIDRATSELGARIDQTNRELADVKKDVRELKGHAFVMRADISALKDDVAELRIDVGEVKLDVRATRVATQNGFDLMTASDTQRSSELADLRTRMERVEAHVGLRSR